MSQTAQQAGIEQRGAASIAGRAAQVLLGIPLGLFQLSAVLWFSLNGPMSGAGDWLVAAWGIAMSASCAVLALLVYRSARARHIAFALLGAQVLFSVVKLVVYHESAALVFGTITAVTLAALWVYHRSARE